MHLFQKFNFSILYVVNLWSKMRYPIPSGISGDLLGKSVGYTLLF